MTNTARLADAIWRGDVGAVRGMIVAGADVNATLPDSGWSPLHVAIEHQHRIVVDVLIAAGASVTFDVDGSGLTPLIHAIDIESDAAWQRYHEPNRASVELTEIVLRAGAPPTSEAVALAERYGNLCAVGLLRRYMDAAAVDRG